MADIIIYHCRKMIGINLANSSDTSKFLSDGVDPRPGGYVMRPIHKFLLRNEAHEQAFFILTDHPFII
jgi:hypothetical protein